MIIQSIPLCSRCAAHEISNWVWENSSKIDKELLTQISLELRDIKLTDGECLVCRHKKIADNCTENILKILEKNNQQEIKSEFEKLFLICVKCQML